MNVVAIIEFSLLVVISISLDSYWSLLNVLQIFAFYALFEVSLPVPLSIFFSYLIKIATFELIEMGPYFASWFSYANNQPYSKRFEILSYDSTSFLVTLSFLAVILAQIILSYLIFGVLHICGKYRGKNLTNFYRNLKNNLFWTTPLVYVMKGYLDITLSIILYFNRTVAYDENNLPINKNGDIIDSYLTIFFSFVCIFIPISGTIFLLLNIKTLKDLKVKNKIERDYHQSKYRTRKCIKSVEAYYKGLDPAQGPILPIVGMIYMARRLLIIFLLFFKLSSSSVI